MPFVGKIDTLRMFLSEMFRGIAETEEEGGVVTFSLHGGQVSSCIA